MCTGNPRDLQILKFQDKYESCNLQCLPKYFMSFGKLSDVPVAKIVLPSFLGNEAE